MAYRCRARFPNFRAYSAALAHSWPSQKWRSNCRSEGIQALSGIPAWIIYSLFDGPPGAELRRASGPERVFSNFLRQPAVQAPFLCRVELVVKGRLDKHVAELEAVQAYFAHVQLPLFLDHMVLLFKVMRKELQGAGKIDPEHIGDNFHAEPFAFHAGYLQQLSLQGLQAPQPLLDNGFHPGRPGGGRGSLVFHPVTRFILQDILVLAQAVESLYGK